MEAIPPASKQPPNVSFAPFYRSLEPSKSSSDLSARSAHDLDATLRASTSTRLEDKQNSDSSEADFYSFEATAVRTPSLGSLASQKGKGKAPVVEITPPPTTHHPRPRASNSLSSSPSHHSQQPGSDDSSDDFFYPRRSGSAPLADAPASAPFYQQEKNGTKIHSSPNLLLGPLLTDYYKSTATGFQPSAISTPPDNSSFLIRPPAHPSSIPIPRVSRPLFALDPPPVAGPSSEPDEAFRKIATFSSFRRWLPNREDTLDVERLAEDSPSLAERERHASLGKKDEEGKFVDHCTSGSFLTNCYRSGRLEALRRVSEAARIPTFAPNLSPLPAPDVFSADSSQPSYYPSPSPPRPMSRSNSSQSSSLESSVYATPLTSSRPDLATSSIAFPTDEERKSEGAPWILTPQTPTPPPRRPYPLLQRPPVLSVIEGSPLSSKHAGSQEDDAGGGVTPTKPAPFAQSARMLASPPLSPVRVEEQDEMLVPPPKLVDDDYDARTDVTSTRKTTTSWSSEATAIGRRSHASSFHGLFRWSRLGREGSVAESSTTVPAVRARTKSEIADEEFVSRSSTPNSAKTQALKHRRHWSSKGDEDDLITSRSPRSPRSPITPISPVSEDGAIPREREQRRRIRGSVTLSSPRELILPALAEARKVDSDRYNHLSAGPLSPEPSPPRAPEPRSQRRVRIMPDPIRRSSIFSGRQRPLLLATSPQQGSPPASSPSTPISSISNHAARVFDLSASSILAHPIEALDALLPAQSLFILGFLLGPWTWLVGGYLLLPNGYIPSQDLEGIVTGRPLISRARPSATAVNPAQEDHSLEESTSSPPLRAYERDPVALSAAELMHHPLARNPSVMPSRRQRLITRIRMCSQALSFTPDDPCDWVWRCRAFALVSGSLITVGVVLAIIAAVNGHI